MEYAQKIAMFNIDMVYRYFSWYKLKTLMKLISQEINFNYGISSNIWKASLTHWESKKNCS